VRGKSLSRESQNFGPGNSVMVIYCKEILWTSPEIFAVAIYCIDFLLFGVGEPRVMFQTCEI
jgi:hypothetical protein